MGIFDKSSPFDVDVEKATNEKSTQDDWGLILEICDKVGRSSTGPKDCLRSIVKRMNNKIPHISLQALTLIDACVQNCGKIFHLEMCTKDFVQEFKSVLNKGHQKVTDTMKELLKKWAEGDFKNDSALHMIPTLYNDLKKDGLYFGSADSSPAKSTSASTVDKARKEENDIAKAIALSLEADSGQPQTSSLYPSTASVSSSLYPSVRAPSPVQTSAKEPRKVRAIYDFEAAEDNELTFKAGEIISILDDSDPNWWKGTNFRGEGLFPANFVTADLSAEPEQEHKKVHFNEDVEVKTMEPVPEVFEIDEEKMDECYTMLQNADPTGENRPDSSEMLTLEEQCKMMGPLIDQELEKIDRKHNMLMELNSKVKDALQMYDDLMKAPLPAFNQPPGPGTGHQAPPQGQPQPPYPMQHMPNTQMYNGQAPYMPQYIPSQIPGQGQSVSAVGHNPQQRFSPVPSSQTAYVGPPPGVQVSQPPPPPTSNVGLYGAPSYSTPQQQNSDINNSATHQTPYHSYDSTINSMPPPPMYQQPQQQLL